MSNHETLKKVAIDNWQSQIQATNSVLDKLTDEQLEQEIAPRRNRGTYILGHLTAVHDMMLPLLRFEDTMFPALKPVFIDAPDKAVSEVPSAQQLRDQWKEVNEKLSAHLSNLSADELFARHSNVSEEGFVTEPHRNRLNVLLSRTNHLSYHRGQLALLQKKD